jgi:ribosomal protein S18 acetylase RimI-like enzyme
MSSIEIEIRSDDHPELEALLEDRLYEFNSRTTSIFDGTLLSAAIEDDDGNVVAGMSGHTWGGCCEIRLLWVDESRRGSGLGTALMRAAEREAMRRGCHQIVLSTHSFQAPRFYERLGFRRLAFIPEYPRGHEQVIYIKSLPAEAGVTMSGSGA